MAKDLRAEFARASTLHREGRLDEAVDIYRRILKVQPGAFDVARLLVLALLQSSRPREALVVARKTREAHPSNAHAHLLLGATLLAEGKTEKALAAFEAAAVLDPGMIEAHYQAGNVLMGLARPAEAVARFDRVLALNPKVVEALANRAVALSLTGRSEAALADCDRLVELQPREPRHHLSRGGTLLELGRFAEAALAADAALRLSPGLADAHFLKGESLLGQADISGAHAAFGAALAHAPERANFQAALARTERLMGHVDTAISLSEAAVEHDSATALTWQELAEARRDAGDLSGALEAVEQALAVDPGLAVAFTTRARLHADLGRPEEARADIDRALAADPRLPMAISLAAYDDLSRGRWAEGWAGYESRSQFLPPPYRPLAFTRWDGQEVPEQLVVVGEQGIGDLIQFGRLLRRLADRGIRTRFVTKERHVPLLSRIDARVEVVSSLEGLDTSCPGLRWVPLASLPGLIAPDPAGWPRAPYLTADPERIARWRDLPGPGFRVGLCWQGDPSPAVDVGRSVPLEAFAPIAAIPGLQLVSLQYGAGAEQIDTCTFGGRIQRLGPQWDADGTFLDTIALLQHLDLVVTTDTSLAHLAGARGVPTLLALRAVPDWRWGRAGDDTDLYGSLRLVRQSRAGDWGEVFTRIARLVSERARVTAT